MRIFIPALLLLLVVSSSAADTKTPKLREWTDNTGTFRVKAKLIDVDEDAKTVRLKLSSGKTVDLPMRRLSSADQKYVTTRQASSASASDRSRTENIAGIDWFQTREDASKAAIGGRSNKDDKPIMCFRALGDLEGFM